VAIAACALLAGPVEAGSIVLSSEHAVAPGVVRVDLWFEDPTRGVELRALQFDLDLNDTGPGSLAAEPGFLGSSTTRSNGNDQISSFPFDLFASVTDPPGAHELRSIHVASQVLDVDGLAAQTAGYPTCSGEACDAQDAGLPRDRIHLGSFDMNYDGRPVYYTLPTSSIFGEDGNNIPDGVDPFVLELRTGTGPTNRAIEGLAPEPAGLVLMGLLAALGAARRSP
jgi:hypothetical protein